MLVLVKKLVLIEAKKIYLKQILLVKQVKCTTIPKLTQYKCKAKITIYRFNPIIRSVEFIMNAFMKRKTLTQPILNSLEKENQHSNIYRQLREIYVEQENNSTTLIKVQLINLS